MSGIGNYPVLQLIISILISIVAILLIISSITIRKIPKSGSHFFCYGIFNRINYPGIQYCQFHDGIDRRIKGRLAWK